MISNMFFVKCKSYFKVFWMQKIKHMKSSEMLEQNDGGGFSVGGLGICYDYNGK